MSQSVTGRLMGDPLPGRSAQAQLEPQLAAPPKPVTPPPPAAEIAAHAPAVEPERTTETDATLRPIEAIQLHLDTRPAPPPTAAPVFLDVDPRSLLVEAAYQRDLTPRSLALIRKIAVDWDWRKCHPPVVVMTDEGGLILDGQHTAIAAASRHDLPMIPVMLVEAASVAERARAFIGLNTGSQPPTAMNLHHAAVAAGDVTALAIERICTTAGATLVRSAFGGYRWKTGDTVAVSAIGGLLARVGERKAARILGALVQAELAPVAANEIKAAEMLFTEGDYADQLDGLDEQGGADLAHAIKTLGQGAARDARVFAAAQCVPLWKALGITWFRKAKKRRKAS